MSVLIYRDVHTAGVAAATMFASALMENPRCNIGVTYDSSLDHTFDSLRAMLSDGLFSFADARLYQLCEFVPDSEDAASVQSLLSNALFSNVEITADRYVVPFDDNRNWVQICSDFESDILDHGGLDLVLLALRQDGSLLYNLAGEELAPVTHVETIGNEKVVSAGMATLMQAKKIMVVATGMDCAETVRHMLCGPVCDKQPVSYLALHQNVTFILDEEAASLL